MSQDGSTDRAGYTLYWEAMSGAMAVEFVLEEIQAPYTLRPVDMAAGEHRSADFLKLNPTGQIPALALPEGQIIGESAAGCARWSRPCLHARA
ncbi:glutathione S-transferase N-terminal domain-containing protein [Psychromarinibacter sp. C21-152]|uniref:Glutathione S-transferase N-terminal domain-containing protein n=1 Tax=Psychromarinibacter sediminicola TaxID=3033385 RepID=A0AAE3NRG0_9RHOB|nr:glutathione S-transferase N-terminal domain-containing protein [Psychromarinibacter sediminicola]MDF0601114.1 glutathione S-transferase N-terminal domain-containing protein [Psychromarinibacter sediminicola]